MSRRFAIAIAWVVACTGGTLGPSTGDDDRFGQPEGEVGEAPVPACPNDPDCGLGAEECAECPDYWVCEQIEADRERCINPGPDYPTGGGGDDWQCEQRGEFVECRRRGGTVPDDGGGDGWDCRQEGEFVVCTDDTPEYPPGGGGGHWTCWYADEFRICESTPPDPGSGDGGDWTCFDTPFGRHCVDDDPDYPDDEDWDCWYEAGELVCRRPDDGDFPPGGGGDDWECEDQGEFIVCTDDTPSYPPGGGGDDWECHDLGEFRVCDGDVPPGGGDDPPPPGTPPGTPPGGGDECTPGTQRWCDDAVYCSWGKQDCLPDGTWGRCIEPRVTSSGLADRPDNECGCRFFYFQEECCEDQADRDGDGHADCLIPADHTAPACPSDGSLCSYCDVHADCADEGICLFRRDGYAFCGSGCGAGCPSGYSCRTVTLRSGSTQQCIPNDDSCE